MTSPNPRLALFLRWSARVTGLLSIGVLLLRLTGVDDWAELRLAAWIGLLLYPFGVLLGLALAWWREGLGAAVAGVSVTAFYLSEVLLAGRLAGPRPLVFTAPAVLFFASWFAHRQGSDAVRAWQNLKKLLLVVGTTAFGACLFVLGTFCYLVATDSGTHGPSDLGAVGLVFVFLTGGAVLGAIVGFVAGVCWIMRRPRRQKS
jgi:hypothetical protein